MKKGDKVTWNYGTGKAAGKVESVAKKRVEKTIKGSKITRNGTAENPAVTVKQADGGRALKRASELRKAK